uniref:Cytochrome b561 domain-containing protein n=1 Tax=Grammatophora oceanica TaxID=210454 RepID=A0A7S1UQR0_9STRA|mmetsp:Transcript_17865/g.26463  ORF Transcript_17865/g.26463 Transcript_17865/m.26463 type:complete len:256 (+) Transcript_17865:128-895(+)|eukprot:CAMPEP_0194043690 /NCGR_PEP_ID=MMETSP0009_2-20130614/15277_1 /TAXON_ID=210454 /ORGANISM="Grammatophora oceanica, Strain CCMP 410" /LENGTH=255 /DNA_ID=CAMNT_0038687987 /DNA_START=121 /DNA_END=888 /DNA_ORIENTATION=-
MKPNSIPASTLIVVSLLLPPVVHAHEGESTSWWIAHGVFMLIAWSLLFPFGTLLAVYRRYVGSSGGLAFTKYGSFFEPHWRVQLVGFLFMMGAFIMGAVGSRKAYGTGNPFEPVLWDYRATPWNRHVPLGVVSMILVVIQMVLGYWHHMVKLNHEKMNDLTAAQDAEYQGSRHTITQWVRPVVPSWFHMILGVLLLVMGYITQIQGLQLLGFIINQGASGNPGAGVIVGYTVVALSIAVFLVSYGRAKASLLQGK